ncbi:murein hydrolase activator EnvC [Streptomyces sp. PT12]|uniref:murein hydrolase activator EnvC family protein n=1 Tax=Streptomyces sp. PT12 TaxID=1510197 RepID=UPI00215C7244|nr:M23 family metallopeptidase [Streptomyces sp. PT12]
MTDAPATHPGTPHARPARHRAMTGLQRAMNRRQRPTEQRPTGRRLSHRAIGCTLLGALVITGPVTVQAVGHGAEAQGPLGPEPFGTGLYDLPLAPLGPVGPVVPRDPFWGLFSADAWADSWTAPVSGHPVSAAYGITGGWAAGYHTGIDWATPTGTTVRSVGPGTVVLAGEAGDYGNAVIIKMTDGYYALYAHLSSVAVRVGQQVSGGTQVGESGDTGRSTGPHLHFEVRAGENYGSDVDPVAYLARHGVTV